MFDSHCHLTDAQLAPEAAAIVARAHAAGVRGMVTIAADAADAAAALALARRHPQVWATAGIHPHVAAAATADELDRVRALIAEPEVVALGETGLDYFYDNSPRAVQQRLFAWHLEQAEASGRPVVVHSRNADDDVIALMRSVPRARGVLHCFSGGPALLEAGLGAGWYISFAGPVTFKRFDAPDLVRQVPDDRLLIETDSPYLAPVPRRGRRNEPAFLPFTCAAVARLREVDTAVVAELTERNARACYGL
ncbi:MAG TPA: TatD family hydrolase [Longimicrobiales bacterium]|nr:TatD family hydrolase [Longimicrobiales bacterium]